MDTETLIWILVFLGGYGLILGFLLRIALSGGRGSGATPD